MSEKVKLINQFFREEKLDSAVVNSIFKKAANQNGMSLYPNPVNNAATVSFTLTENAVVSVKVLNMLGAVVATATENANLNIGKNIVNINTENLQNGNYIVVLNVNGINTAALKMVK